ncbi:3,4-dioxygenase subunit beta [Kineococcus sp. GCM10028916]|uniref:dioxygenase family protein n=1 Tax=Kineococcus sp. GCM10028916 TaxID=3273394 RepID=UPI00362F3E31
MTDVPRNPPEFEGRTLPRPQDDLDEQGLGFDVVTVLTRRRALGVLGFGLSGAGLVACSDGEPAAAPSPTTGRGAGTGSSTVAEIPEEMAGPFPGDGSNGPNVLQRSGVVRGDIRSSFEIGATTAPGIPLTLTLTVLDLTRGGVPFVGAAVYAWQCDREGRYSLYSPELRGENYLRGVQVAAADGTVTFTSVFPGCYTGRWPHVHFEVYTDLAAIDDSADALTTSQLALPQADCTAVYATTGYERSAVELAGVTLADDLVFRDDLGVRQLATVTGDSGDVAAGYAATLTVGVGR